MTVFVTFKPDPDDKCTMTMAYASSAGDLLHNCNL